MTKLAQVLRKVDPNLTVVSGHRRRNWDKAGGAICPKCREEAVRFRPLDGLCPACARLLDEKFDRDEKKHARFLKLRKAHNARIDGKKKRGR